MSSGSGTNWGFGLGLVSPPGRSSTGSWSTPQVNWASPQREEPTIGYPPGGGSRAIGSCGRADSSPVPTTTTMSLFSVVYGGGSASRQTILEPTLILTLAYWSPQRSPASCLGLRYCGTA